MKVVLYILLLLPIQAIADDYIALSVEPLDIGVFVENQTQQFHCFGKLPDGSWVNITNEVDWYVEEYPFEIQTIPASKTVSIDENGLATVLQSWGRVNVSACYPKGCNDSAVTIGLIVPLLLSK